MLYGMEYEEIARHLLFNSFQMKHEDARVITNGIVLYKHAPWIGGSPDAILSCSCHGQFLVKIECPFRLKDTGVENWEILEYLDEEQNLKRNHTYFNQVNLYQGI